VITNAEATQDGTVLTLNYNGQWVSLPLPTGTQAFVGNFLGDGPNDILLVSKTAEVVVSGSTGTIAAVFYNLPGLTELFLFAPDGSVSEQFVNGVRVR
jgi:hypothetical protein